MIHRYLGLQAAALVAKVSIVVAAKAGKESQHSRTDHAAGATPILQSLSAVPGILGATASFVMRVFDAYADFHREIRAHSRASAAILTLLVVLIVLGSLTAAQAAANVTAWLVKKGSLAAARVGNPSAKSPHGAASQRPGPVDVVELPLRGGVRGSSGAQRQTIQPERIPMALRSLTPTAGDEDDFEHTVYKPLVASAKGRAGAKVTAPRKVVARGNRSSKETATPLDKDFLNKYRSDVDLTDDDE